MDQHERNNGSKNSGESEEAVEESEKIDVSQINIDKSVENLSLNAERLCDKSKKTEDSVNSTSKKGLNSQNILSVSTSNNDKDPTHSVITNSATATSTSDKDPTHSVTNSASTATSTNTKVPSVQRTKGQKLKRKRKTRVARSAKSWPYAKRKQKRRGVRVPPPYNTTQFLMSDYNYNKFSPEVKVEEYSADNEVDFLLKEFSKEYENSNSDLDYSKARERGNRLAALCRQDLMSQYLTISGEVGLLERRLIEVKETEERKASEGQVEYDWRKGEAHMEPETAEKIRVFQEEISKLEMENRDLVESDEVCYSHNSYHDWTSDSSEDSEFAETSDISSDSGGKEVQD